jgi:hypothetical protein
MNRIFAAAAAAILAFAGIAALAQSPVLTQNSPLPELSNASGSVAVTNTFQSVFDANFAASTTGRGRSGCIIGNTGSTTLWVHFGPIASATTPLSASLAQHDRITCNEMGGSVVQSQVSVTGTSGGTFFAVEK